MAKITFQGLGKVVDADPQDAPFGGLGKSGSLLDLASVQGIEVPHDCGGSCLCITCHVRVVSGGEHLSPPTPKELRLLEQQAQRCGCTGTRLACQAVLKTNDAEVVVEVPAH